MTFITVYSAYVQSLFFLWILHFCSFTYVHSLHFSGHYTSFFHICPFISFFQTLNTTLERQPIHNLLSANGLMIVMHQRCIAPTYQVFIENLTLSLNVSFLISIHHFSYNHAKVQSLYAFLHIC